MSIARTTAAAALHRQRRNVAVALLLAIAAPLLQGCNRAAARIPGASGTFPESPTGFIAARRSPLPIAVLPATDLRDRHIGEAIADSGWKACSTDTFWEADSASKLVQDRVAQELASAALFSDVTKDATAGQGLVLQTDILAFCSDVRGFLILRVAGIVSLRYRVLRDGQPLFEQRIDKVVTDADPEYTGPGAGMIEQIMNRTMSDAFREDLRELLKALAAKTPESWEASGSTG